MTDINPLLDKVSKVAQRLNQSSDSLTETLNRVDKRLAEDKIGLEFWLEHPALSVKRYLNYETERLVEDYTVLGFTKLENGWGLAVKTDTAVLDEDGETGDNWSIKSSVPIAQASRALRIAALENLALFLEQYAEAIERAVTTVAGAVETLK